MTSLTTTLGRVTLKNPLIAGSAEHLIEVDGIRRALKAGVGAAIVKSTNKSEAGRDQLQRAEYMLFDEHWNPVTWGPNAPASAFVACRSGLTPQPFDQWLEQTVRMDNEARGYDSYAVPSVILADLNATVRMAKQIEQAGFASWNSILALRMRAKQKVWFRPSWIPANVSTIVSTVRKTISLPLWVKITGQSESVPDLAAAAFAAGADAVVMAGRSLGLIPDVETLEPMLGTTLGVGGFCESSADVSVAGTVARESRGRQAADRHERRTDRTRYCPHDARGRIGGSNVVAGHDPGAETLSSALAEFQTYLERKNLDAAELIGVAADRRRPFPAMPLKTDNWKKYVAT